MKVLILVCTLALVAFNDVHLYPNIKLSQQEVQVITANGQFANKMYKSLIKNPESTNILFSPFSAHAALSMLYQAAGGATKDAVAEGLSVPEQQDVAEGYHNVLDKLNSAQRVEFSVANKAFVNHQKHIKQLFKDTVTTKFYSEVETVDFSNTPNAIKIVNSWVEQKTNKKITDLLKEGDVDAGTDMVLVNAVYFKGRWIHPFDEDLTKSKPFYLNKDDTVSHEIMHKIEEHYQYKDDQELGAQIVEIPYVDSDYSMIVLLPHQKEGLADLESKLVETDLGKVMDGSSIIKMNLGLPKFNFEQSMSLRDQLKDIGMGKIFEDDADLSGLVEENNVKVSDVIQKTFINVDELGTEAASTTALFMVGAGLDLSQPVEFLADHPFVFMLVKTDRTATSNAVNVLFYGRVKNPAA